MHERRRTPGFKLRRVPRARVTSAAIGVALLLGVTLSLTARGPVSPLPALPAALAIGERVDTFVVGGFAQGGFEQALAEIATEMEMGERAMLGAYLDRVYAQVLGTEGLGERGRLRLVYERRSAPDGSPRSIRVLGAEAAVQGAVHTAIVHQRGAQVGYFDDWGTALDRTPWVDPLERLRVTSPFGRARRHPILGRRLPHLGIDLAAPEGTPVRAAADGRVSHAGPRGGYGNMIEIQHPNGYSTRYAHLLSIDPAVTHGAPVHQGSVIGRVGQTGLATGPHLHFEVRLHGEATDPLTALRGRGVADDLAHDPEWRLQRERIRRMISAVPTIRTADEQRPRLLNSDS